MKLLNSIIFVFLLLCWNAEAAVVTWTVNDVFIEGDGLSGTVDGSFDFDAETEIYSNININGVTSNYDFALIVSGSSATSLGLLEGVSVIQFKFNSALTNAGGTIGVDVTEVLLSGPAGLLGSGTITAPTIPVPPAVWLFGSGFIGLIGIARRKKA